jgi:hypothetical protein
MASAMRRANFSSPYSRMIRVRAAGGYVLTISSAVVGVVGSIRMSSGEPAGRLIKLHRGDAKIEERTVHRGLLESVQHVGQLVVDGLGQRHPVAVRGQSTSAALEGLGIAVEPDQPYGGELGQHGLGVPAQADGSVHMDRSTWTITPEGRSEQLEAAGEQHRCVLPPRRARATAPTRPCPTGVLGHLCPMGSMVLPHVSTPLLPSSTTRIRGPRRRRDV